MSVNIKGKCNRCVSNSEQSLILTAQVSADKNPEENSDPGNATRDQVFILGIKEIARYFDSDYARFCKPTAYAVEQGCKVYPDIKTCWWWTRIPGCDNYYVTDVRGDGTFNYIVSDADRDYLCVRPAMWIDLTGLIKDQLSGRSTVKHICCRRRRIFIFFF